MLLCCFNPYTPEPRPSLVRPRILSYRTAEEPTELRSSPSRTHSSLLHSPTHHTSPFRPSSPVAPRLYLTSPASPACRVLTMSRLNLLDSPRHSVTPHSARPKSRLLSASLSARPRPSITLRISPKGAGREIANVNPRELNVAKKIYLKIHALSQPLWPKKMVFPATFFYSATLALTPLTPL